MVQNKQFVINVVASVIMCPAIKLESGKQFYIYSNGLTQTAEYVESEKVSPMRRAFLRNRFFIAPSVSIAMPVEFHSN